MNVKMKSTKVQTLGTIWIETSLHVLGEHNGMKTEFYRSNTKSQGLVSAHFALIIIM